MVDGTMEASLHGELKEKEKQAFSTPAISLLSLYNTQCRASHGHFSFCSSHHCGLRINHTHLTRASSHSARNVVLCTSRITLLLCKLQQGHIRSPVRINPLCSNCNSYPPSTACQYSHSALERLQR